MAATVGSLRIELSASIAQFQEDMGRAASAVKQTAGEFTKAGNDFKKIGAQMQGVGLALSKAITLPLVGISAAVAKVGMDFEDAFAGVKKTVQGTPQQLQAISDAFRDMAKSIPTSASELAKIGEIAGQLGVSQENIVSFTKTISEIGTVTTLSTEQAATEFAKLANVLGVPKDQFESLGSAVYSLGNFGASTEQEMLAMAERIAGAGAAAGLNAPQVLGLANALASVGLDAEAGGTAMSKIIIKIAQAAHDGGRALEEFAKVAGVSSEQFRADFQANAGAAVVEFVEGLGRIKKSGGDLIGTVEALGFEEVRLRDATLRMAQAGDLVADSVKLGSSAFKDHTAFVAAVQERYKTTTNELKILGNQIKDVGLTLFTALKPAIETGIRLVQALLPYVDSMAKAFSNLPGGVQLAVIGLGGVAAALGPAIWFAGQMVSSLASLTLAFGKGGVASRAIVGSLGLVEKAMGALGSAVVVDGALMFEWGKDTVAVGGWLGKIGTAITGLIGGGLGPLTGAFELVGAAIAAIVNPVTLAIGAFAAVGLAVAALTGHWADVKAGMSAVVQVAKDIGSVLWYLAKTVVGTLVDGLIGLAKILGSGIVLAFQGLVAVARAVITPFVEFGIAINDALNNLGPMGTTLKVVGIALLGIVNPVAGVVAGVALMVGHWNDLKQVAADVLARFVPLIQGVKDLGTVLNFLVTSSLESAGQMIRDFGAGASDLGKAIAGDVIYELKSFVTWLGEVGTSLLNLLGPLKPIAEYLAGPFISAFKAVGNYLSSTVPGWVSSLRALAAEGLASLHEYAEGIREFSRAAAEGFKQADKQLADYRKSISDRAIPKAALEIGSAMDLLKSQLAGVGKSGGNGFDELAAQLKAARAELAKLSSGELASLTAAVKSGAFSMKELKDSTGLSDIALKLFQDQVRDSGKALKESQSIFDDYRKKVAELTTALNESLKFDVPVGFISRQFGSEIRDVVEQANILGKEVPQIISDAFLKITIQEGTDKLQKEFAKFGEDLNKQVKEDMERVNASVIKTLGVIVEAGQSTADSAAQFSIEGLKNEIKNLEATTGETKRSLDLRKQLYAEEYQYQVTLIQREAQAKKDGLDKTGAFYNEALDAIDQATASKMGLASQTYQQKIREMQTSTKSWKDSLGELASAFSAIGQGAGGAFGEVVKEIGGVINSLGMATKAVKDFNKASQDYDIAVANNDKGGQYAAAGNKVAAIASGIGAVAQATSAKSVGSAVIGGAATGAALGSVIPGVGTGVGAGVGALVGLIRALHKGPAEKAAIDVGRDFGVNISDGLAKELGELRKTIGAQAASVFDLDKIIAEGGGLRSNNIDNYTKKLRDTFALVKQGALTAADGAVVLDKNFANFANEFLANGPLISKDLVEIVRLTDDLGTSSKAVGDFINKQVTGTILPGLQAYAGASKDATAALAENQKKLADLQDQLAQAAPGPDQEKIKKDIAEVTAAIAKEQGVIAATAVTSQGAADALSASVAVAFAEMMKAGTPILDIVDQLSPVVADLGKQFEAAGFSGGVAFQNIQTLVGLAADEIAGPAITAATGLGQALAGLSNIGQLDQVTFTGLTDQIDATFNSLIAQGQNGTAVLSLMQGPLQTIWQLSTEFGYAVDAGTQALLDQALAAGVVGEKFKTPQQQMIDALTQTNSILGSIAKALGATLPEAAQTGATGVKNAFAGVNPKVRVDIEYNDPGFTPDVSPAATGGYVTPMGVQHFARGGMVKGFKRVGTDTVPAMLTPGEVVLNQAQQASIQSALAGVSGSGQAAASALQDTMSAAVQGIQDQFASLPTTAATTADEIVSALGGITIPDIVIKVRLDDSGISATTIGESVPGFQGGSGGIQDFGAGTVAMLHGREGVFTESQVVNLSRAESPPAPASTPIQLTLNINAIDSSSLRDHVTRPGGIADMIIDSISQGKRGRDERLRRGLAVTNG